MSISQITQILADTLNPTLTNRAEQKLRDLREQKQFPTSLLLIADDPNQQIYIKQAALVCLKNMISDHLEKGSAMLEQDADAVKSSILEALIRNALERKLIPTLREIVLILAKKYLPNEWPHFLDTIADNLTNSSDFTVLFGTLEALRAVYTVFGESVTQQIALSNLCNKTMLPLMTLASKLFQNYSSQISVLLLNIFKILSTSLFFHLSEIVILNLHSWMIFVKKILDIQSEEMFALKKICLRILYRIYQRHANANLAKDKMFAYNFHEKYTRSFVETLLLQIINPSQHNSTAHLIKLSISCLSYVYREHQPSAMLINNYRTAIINLCLQRYKTSAGKVYPSYSEHIRSLSEQRLHFRQLLMSFLQRERAEEDQGQNHLAILSILAQHFQQGDQMDKELALFLLSEISSQAQNCTSSIDEYMLRFVLRCVEICDSQTSLVRGAICELISSYEHLRFPEESLIPIGTAVYNCLMCSSEGNSQADIFLKVHATKAFNMLLEYSSIVAFVSLHVKTILPVYTSMLEVDASVIKNLEKLLACLDYTLWPYAEELIHLLIDMFSTYQRNYQIESQTYGYSLTQSQDENNDDSQEDNCQVESNLQAASKACISSIRQVLQLLPSLSQQTHNGLHSLILTIFNDPEQSNIQEGFNILNLILYANSPSQHQRYIPIIRVIIYAILGIPSSYRPDEFAQMIQNVCVEPDYDILENSVGCLRNFVAKTNCLGLTDCSNTSFADYYVSIVRTIHENPFSTQTNKCIVLTLYMTLVEYQVGGEQMLGVVVGDVCKWLGMEQEVEKKVYTPIYLQILLLSLHFSPHFPLPLDLNALGSLLLLYWDKFKCDYQLIRLLVGVADLLCLSGLLQPCAAQLLDRLPETVRKICLLRQSPSQADKDSVMDDQAEEQRLFGVDENSLIGAPLSNVKPSEQDLQLEEWQENDWEDQFNKFYSSPLDSLDEISYLVEQLKGGARGVVGLMDFGQQQLLASYIANAPPRTG